MGLNPTYSADQIRQELEAVLQRIDRAILRTLRYLGEQCVNHARSLNTYQDVTGNLRSSIGYIIVREGAVVRENFERNLTKKDGQKRRRNNYGRDGLSTGQQYARELARNYPTGWALVVVAGMNYATSVESRGKDVLASAEILAEEQLRRMLQELKIDIDRMR